MKPVTQNIKSVHIKTRDVCTNSMSEDISSLVYDFLKLVNINRNLLGVRQQLKKSK